MNKQRIFAFTLVLVLASAALALAYQQTPPKQVDLFSTPYWREAGRHPGEPQRTLPAQAAPQTPHQPLDAQAMQERILKLEAKVAELDRQFQEMQRPRIQPVHEPNR